VRTTLFHVLAVLALVAGRGAADPKRAVPDYDGRGNPDAHTSSALWIPRVVLAPAYAVHEYVVRRPLGALVTTAERDRWPSRISDLLSFGPDHTMIAYPTALYDFGALPSVGATFSARDLVLDGNTLTLHGATWGAKWLSFYVDDRYGSTETKLAFVRRQDMLFVGIGPDVTSATRSRYGVQRFEASETLTQRLTAHTTFAVTPGLRDTEIRDGTCCGDPSLYTRIAAGELMAPPGLDAAHATVYTRAALQLDTREPRPAPGGGVYIGAYGEPHVDTSTGQSWVRYGGAAGVAVDLDGRQRVLRVLAMAELVDPLNSGEIPFYELAQLGGDNTMSGFLPGWMNGRSAATAELSYTWPVWVWLDGQARFAVGNAFDEHFADFAPKKLRMSADIGVTSIGDRDHGFELLFGVGSETFEQGARITSFRVAIGTRQGL
jgi:hypothetical protein